MTAIIIPFPARPARPPAADHQLDHLLRLGGQLIERMDEQLLDEWLAGVDCWTPRAVQVIQPR